MNKSFLTKKEVIVLFKKYALPRIQKEYEKDGKKDNPARSQAWNDFTDGLMKQGEISRKQYSSWTNPF